jgi:hypothetical protein
MTITERDLDLLETLTLRVPMLTLRQTAELWWPEACSQRAARQRLALLAKSGWIQQHTVNVHPLLATLRPLFALKPGAENPDAERIACELRTRWFQPARPREVCVASPQAACLFGSAASGLPSLEHRDHDLRLSGAKRVGLAFNLPSDRRKVGMSAPSGMIRRPAATSRRFSSSRTRAASATSLWVVFRAFLNRCPPKRKTR